MNTQIAQTVIFGGSFDPFHHGHLQALEFLSSRYQHVILATTEQNPFKQERATDFWQRLEMLTLVLSAEFIRFQLGGFPINAKVYISDFPYTYAKDFIAHLRAQDVHELAWAVGPDLVDEVKNWKDWESLAIPLVEVPEEIPLRATEVRANLDKLHPVLKSFIQEHKLYQG